VEKKGDKGREWQLQALARARAKLLTVLGPSGLGGSWGGWVDGCYPPSVTQQVKRSNQHITHVLEEPDGLGTVGSRKRNNRSLSERGRRGQILQGHPQKGVGSGASLDGDKEKVAGSPVWKKINFIKKRLARRGHHGIAGK